MHFDDYIRKYEKLTNQHEELQSKLDDLIKSKSTKENQAQNMRIYLNNINHSEDELEQWNESIWMLMVESAVVHRNSSINFKFRNGEESIN